MDLRQRLFLALKIRIVDPDWVEKMFSILTKKGNRGLRCDREVDDLAVRVSA